MTSSPSGSAPPPGRDTALPLAAAIVPEAALSPSGRAEIRGFLVAAYAPRFSAIFSLYDFWGGPAEARVILRDDRGAIAAHLGFSLRTIAVGEAPVRVAGVGAVATAPTQRGRGAGRAIFAALARHLAATDAAFALLECRDAVVPFYARCGFGRSVRTVTAVDPETGLTDVSTSNLMTMPLAGVPFPPGDVDLRGMRW